jgi:hypothetical protein
MRTYGGVDVYINVFLTLALDAGEWSMITHPPLFCWGKNPRYPLERRLGGPHNWCERHGKEKKSLPLSWLELRPLGCPALSQSLFRLRCPGSMFIIRAKLMIFFLLVGWDFWYCGHCWPIVSAPDDRRGWLWRNWWNEDWQGKPKYSEKTCSSATLSTPENVIEWSVLLCEQLWYVLSMRGDWLT